MKDWYNKERDKVFLEDYIKSNNMNNEKLEEAIKNGTVKAGEVRPDFEVLPVNVVRLLLSLREQEMYGRCVEDVRKSILGEIEKMKILEIEGYPSERNIALSDIQSLLKK